jgi:hypothetical protein
MDSLGPVPDMMASGMQCLEEDLGVQSRYESEMQGGQSSRMYKDASCLELIPLFSFQTPFYPKIHLSS